MTVLRMEHLGIVVEDLGAAKDFFLALGLELQGEMSLDNRLVDRIVGLEGVSNDVAMMQTPDGHGKLELIQFHSPSHEGEAQLEPANAPGLRHLLFAVDDIEAAVAALKPHGGELLGEVVNYQDSYLLCYLRGPAGIIVELAEKVSRS